MGHESDNYTYCDWCFWYSNLKIIKGTGGLRYWRQSGDHPNDSIIENGEKTEKSSGDLLSLKSSESPSTKTDVKNYNE